MEHPIKRLLLLTQTPSNRSKTTFEAKGRIYTTGKVIQHLFIIDLYA